MNHSKNENIFNSNDHSELYYRQWLQNAFDPGCGDERFLTIMKLRMPLKKYQASLLEMKHVHQQLASNEILAEDLQMEIRSLFISLTGNDISVLIHKSMGNAIDTEAKSLSCSLSRY
jgi:hypothetical protein